MGQFISKLPQFIVGPIIQWRRVLYFVRGNMFTLGVGRVIWVFIRGMLHFIRETVLWDLNEMSDEIGFFFL